MSLLVLCTLFTISLSVTIWNDPLDSSNGDHLNWTILAEPGIGSISAPYTSNAADCPLNNHCWQFHKSASAYYISPTLGFNNISITYSVSGLDLEPQAGDQCQILYSMNSLTAWISAANTTSNTPSTNTIPLPPVTYNTIGVGIKLASISNTKGHDSDACFFQDISFNGNPITSAPTTATHTNNPTQYPITSLPTTHQITNAPSAPTSTPTDHPVSITPTQHPTTSIPTLITSITSLTSAITTTYVDIEDTKDEQSLGFLDELLDGSAGSVTYFAIYIGIGCIVACAIVLIICCCCCKSNKSKKRASIPPKIAVSNTQVEKVTVPAMSPEASINSGGSPMGKGVDIMGFEEDISPPIGGDVTPDVQSDKYDSNRVHDNAKRTNALPQDFWREESESYEKNQVINRWKRGMSNVMDAESTRDVGRVKRTNSRHRRADQANARPQVRTAAMEEVPPPPSSPHPSQEEKPVEAPQSPVDAMQQVMGYRSGTNDEDSSDESIMRKQSIYQGDYDPKAPANDDMESDDSSLGDMLTLTEPINILDANMDDFEVGAKTQKPNKKFVIMVHNEDGAEVEAQSLT
eukprot:47722_1